MTFLLFSCINCDLLQCCALLRAWNRAPNKLLLHHSEITREKYIIPFISQLRFQSLEDVVYLGNEIETFWSTCGMGTSAVLIVYFRGCQPFSYWNFDSSLKLLSFHITGRMQHTVLLRFEIHHQIQYTSAFPPLLKFLKPVCCLFFPCIFKQFHLHSKSWGKSFHIILRHINRKILGLWCLTSVYDSLLI